jgi:hypothetical protein
LPIRSRGVPLNDFPENGSRRSALPPSLILIFLILIFLILIFLILIFLILIFLILIFLILIFATPWILLLQRSDSLPCLAFAVSMLRISPAALHLAVGGGSGRDCPSPEQSLLRPCT